MSTGDPARSLAPGLYLVATPIGNLQDITLRAIDVLRAADRIACEDTRQTAKLLAHFGIATPTVSYHQHNEAGRAGELMESLRAGARIAVVSDAGTPGIADPGAVLAREAIAAGIAVFPIPGANAALAALVAGGLPAGRFAFHGFLPAKAGQRRSALETLRDRLRAHPGDDESPATQIFYETPHRILEALDDIAAVFGPAHRIVLARELTKLHEEFLRGTVTEISAALRERATIRGEMVLLLDGAIATETALKETIGETIARHMAQGMTEKDAIKESAKAHGMGRSEAYREWQRTAKRVTKR